MNKLLTQFPIKGEFAKNAIILTFGTSISQVIPIIFYPILGRIFDPADFGLLATLTSITAILVVISSGKYENSILITDTKSDAASIIVFTLIISFSFLLVSSVLLQVFSEGLTTMLNEQELGKWIFICPISAFSLIVYKCYNEWCVRQKSFKNLSWNKIINSTSVVLSKLLFGIIKISSAGLVVGDLFGRLFSAGVCVVRAIHTDKEAFTKVSIDQMLFLAKRFSKFPKYSLPGNLLNTIGVSLPVFIIGAYFNSTEVGYYAMTMAVLSIPITVISRALSDVFRQRANEEFVKTGSCIIIYRKLLKILAVIGISGSSLVYFILPGVFSLFLGEEWRTAGLYSQILLPMIAIDFISISLSGVFIVAEKLKADFLLEIYYVSITAISLLIGCVFFQSMKITLIFFSVGRSTAYLVYIYLTYKYSKGNKATLNK